ncbi:HNH endonuclease [Paenibacillaceae bacterium GAS479]|nr:HNH endonuclease [Paenibacillaceae bacterium GAS479]
MKQERIDLLHKLFPSKYQFDSETNEIRSNFTGNVMRTRRDRGYEIISFSLNSKKFIYGVHEIVAYFGGINILDTTVNHIDGNKQNNNITNLEAMSREENGRHAHRIGLKKYKLSKEDVVDLRRWYATGTVTQLQIGKRYGLTPSVVSRIIRKVAWAHVD